MSVLMMLESRIFEHPQDRRTYLNTFQFTRNCKNELTIRLRSLLTTILLRNNIFLLPGLLSKFTMGNAKLLFIPTILFHGASHHVDLTPTEVVGHLGVIVVSGGRLLKGGELLCLGIVHGSEGWG